MQIKKTRDPLNEGFNKLFKNILSESSIRDDIDADADDKKEYAKKVFMKKKDDADSDKDYKPKKSGLKEPRQLKEAKWPLSGDADLELEDGDYVLDEDTGDIHIEDSVIHWYPGHRDYLDIRFADDNDDKIYTYKLVEYNKEEVDYPWTFEYVSEKKEFVESKKCVKESSKRDDIDADADDKKEAAKKAFMRKKDDADSDKDYKLKKAGLKEPRELKETVSDILTAEEFLQWHDYEVDPKKNWLTLERIYNLFKTRGFKETDDVDVCYEQMPSVDKAQITEWVKSTRLEESIDKKAPKDLKESDKPAATSIKDAQKWVDYDMKKYGKISERTNKLIKKAGFQIIKDDHGDYEVTAGKFEEIKRLGRKK